MLPIENLHARVCTQMFMQTIWALSFVKQLWACNRLGRVFFAWLQQTGHRASFSSAEGAPVCCCEVYGTLTVQRRTCATPCVIVLCYGKRGC